MAIKIKRLKRILHLKNTTVQMFKNTTQDYSKYYNIKFV